MTIQKTNVQFRNKNYEVILEDGIVSYIDPVKPDLRKSYGQPRDLKITTIDGAKKIAIQMIERALVPNMTFSD